MLQKAVAILRRPRPRKMDDDQTPTVVEGAFTHRSVNYNFSFRLNSYYSKLILLIFNLKFSYLLLKSKMLATHMLTSFSEEPHKQLSDDRFISTSSGPSNRSQLMPTVVFSHLLHGIITKLLQARVLKRQFIIVNVINPDVI